MDAITPQSVIRYLIMATGFSSIISARLPTEIGPLRKNKRVGEIHIDFISKVRKDNE